MASCVALGIWVGLILCMVIVILSPLYERIKKSEYNKKKERFKKFEGHLAYLIYLRMSQWIRTDVDDMQRKFDEFKVNTNLLEPETERLNLEAPPQDHQEQMQQEAIRRQQKLETEHQQNEVERRRLEAEQKPQALLKKQDEERQQKEQAAAIKQYWESMQPELNSFSQSSENTVKKAAGMKILEISEENFSLRHLKQQYQHVLTDYVQPLQESEADKSQKKKVLEAVFQELYGWAI